ncbi:ATP-dependent DNA helicase yku80 [Microbotryomycetes sp. JL221]|nr:ATP-dependent DNA helicase yku80 [Microbotryomycetes sp. JL221]
MAVSPSSAAVFVVDCSYKMSLQRPFTQGQGDDTRQTITRPIDVAKQYVKAKVIQRIIRELKTTPATVLLYGTSKTKNVLTARAREQDSYDKHEDPYRYMYQLLQEAICDVGTLERIDTIEAGRGPDAVEGSDWSADAHSALILAMEELEAIPKSRNYTKDIYLLTDGESATDWDRWEETVQRMNERGMALTVVGFNFDDAEFGYKEEDKSTIKRTNEHHFHEIVDSLTQPSICATLAHALDAVSHPNIKSVKTVKSGMILTLGDRERYPDRSLMMHIEVRKAIAVAPLKSMKKFSLKMFEQRAGGAGESQSQRGQKRTLNGGFVGDNLQSQHEYGESQPSTSKKPDFGSQSMGGDKRPSNSFKYSMGHIGRTLDKMLEEEKRALEDDDDDAHGVTVERRYHYKPIYETADAQLQQTQAEASASDPKGKGRAKDVALEDLRNMPLAAEDHLSLGYYYGGDIVAAEDLEDGQGTLGGLSTGMMIVGFMLQSKARLDWRINDALYVNAASGQTGSEHLFSALVNAMTERKACAVVRYVGKSWTESKSGTTKWPEPRLGLLWPAIEDTPGGVIEFAYWVRMPFAEDLRPIVFPSLDIVYGQSGVKLATHANLPTKEQQAAMDDFVDAMDVSAAGPPDDEGNPTHWFNIEESFSPAIHNVNNALVFRLSNPEGELPPVSRHLTRFLDPPSSVVEQGVEAIERAIKCLDVTPAPPKPKGTYKGRRDQADAIEHDYDPVHMLGLGNGPSQVTQTGYITGSSSRTHPNERSLLGGAPGPVKKPSSNVKLEDPTQARRDDEDKDAEMAFRGLHPPANLIKSEPASAPTAASSVTPTKPVEDVAIDDEEPDTEEDDEEDHAASISRPILSDSNLEQDFLRLLDAKGVEASLPPLFNKVKDLVNQSASKFSAEQGKSLLAGASLMFTTDTYVVLYDNLRRFQGRETLSNGYRDMTSARSDWQ